MRGRARVTLTLLLVALLATSTLPTTTALSTPRPATADSDQHQSRVEQRPESILNTRPVEVAVSQVNESAYTVTYTVNITDRINAITLEFQPSTTIVTKEGGSFKEKNNKVEWTYDETRPESVTVRINLDRRWNSGGCFCTVADGWLYGPMPRGLIKVETNSGIATDTLYAYHERTNISRTGTIEGTGYITPWLVYFGEYDTKTTTSNGQTITLIIPAGTTPPERTSRQEISTVLADSASTLNTGQPRPSPISIFVHPYVNNSDPEIEFTSYRIGGQYRESTILVSELVGPVVYIHEYVHSRGGFSTTTKTKWLTEAFATYYGYLLEYQHGDETWEDTNSTFHTFYTNGTLGEPTTWSSRSTPYDKGSLALAVLDTKIRAATDGEHSLEDVFGRITGPEYPVVTVKRFKAVVAEVVGDRRFDPVIDQIINNSTLPTASASEWQYLKQAEPEANRRTYPSLHTNTPTQPPTQQSTATTRPSPTTVPPPTIDTATSDQDNLQLPAVNRRNLLVVGGWAAAIVFIALLGRLL